MSGPQPGSLEYWAATAPEAVGVIDGEKIFNWKVLNDGADRLAEGLARRGLSSGDLLVARLHIRAEWLMASAAAGKLGLRLLGLNWRLIPTETRYVLENSGAAALLCDDADPAALAPALDGLGMRVLCSVERAAAGFETLADLMAEAPLAPRFAAAPPSLVLYTSGTTGLPKGVVMRGVREATSDEARRIIGEYQDSVSGARSLGDQGPVLVTMPMHHGAGPAVVWGATARGRTMVLLRRFDPEEVLRLIDRHRITTWNAVPTMYKRIAGLPPDVLARYDVSSIRTLSVGAAPVPYSLKEWILSHFGEVLTESYGTTETGMITGLDPSLQRAKPGSSGLPHRHVAISIRAEDGTPLGVGEEGEIWVRTPVTIIGYLNAKDLGPDTLDADGFFRTGDVGRLDKDGHLFITDRAKDMIVSGGVNLYPAEIEAALITHPAVQDVAVIGVPDPEFGEAVKAFCELKPGSSASPEEIAEHARTRLASYKRPKSIDIVAELPRNTMGKLLKRELRAPYWQDEERKV